MTHSKFTITGYSDDLICIDQDGDQVEEYDAYDSVATIKTLDGWKYSFEYTGPFWKFALIETGAGVEPQLTEATDEDDDYSDKLTVHSGFSIIIRGKTYKCGKID